MKRKIKLIRNCVLSIIILFGIYYFGGFYFSKENYMFDKLRSLRIEQAEIIMEFIHDNECITVVHDKEENFIGLIGSKRIGILYVSDSSSIRKIEESNENVLITGMASSTKQIIVLYRMNPNISKVIAEFEDGTEKQFDNWTCDFDGTMLERDNWLNGKYKVYNSNNELIEVIEY